MAQPIADTPHARHVVVAASPRIQQSPDSRCFYGVSVRSGRVTSILAGSLRAKKVTLGPSGGLSSGPNAVCVVTAQVPCGSVCPNGHTVAASAAFCGDCGARIQILDVPPPATAGSAEAAGPEIAYAAGTYQPVAEPVPGSEPHNAVTDSALLTPALMPSASPNGAATAAGAPRGRRRWPVLVALACAIVLVGGAVTAWLLRPQTDAHYLSALKAAHLAGAYPSDKAAVAHGKAFCRQLSGGHDAQGYKSEKIAVQYYCRSFLAGFKVVPTPAEQQSQYLRALRDGSFGGTYPSDAAAVAHAKSVCENLKSGGKQQGMPVDLIGVQTYCPEFTGGFHVLQTIDVDGTFTLHDSSPNSYFPSISANGRSCEGSDGYSDISDGTEVIVKNGAGATLAHASLGNGTGDATSCEFTFKVKLTEGEDDYVVTVGHRGELHLTFEQLQTSGIGATLGS